MPKSKISPQRWAQVRNDYELGKGSCRQLAELYGLNQHAVNSRCKREGWRETAKALKKRLDRKVVRAINNEAETMVDRAKRFVERTADESEEWLDAIQLAKRMVEVGDVDALVKLVTAWKVPVNEGRKAYGLDRGESEVTVNVLNKLDARTNLFKRMPDGRVLTMAQAMREMRNDQANGHDDRDLVTVEVEVEDPNSPAGS